MLSELKKEILSSDSIDLLVSFIKWSAIRPLLVELTAFTKREGVRLRVIATTYTQATDYKAIVALAELPNTEVKINYETNHARMQNLICLKETLDFQLHILAHQIFQIQL